MLNAIRSQLRHRAAVQRYKEVFKNGSPTFTWVTVATDVPCLLDALGFAPQVEVQSSVTDTSEADRNGRLFVAPEADVLPADRVTVTAWGRSSVWTVQPYPSHVDSPRGPSHRELRVREEPPPANPSAAPQF